MHNIDSNGRRAKRARGFATLSTVAALALSATAWPVKAAPFTYVANYDSNSVTVVDTPTQKVVATIPVGINPRGVAVAPDGKHAYVASSSGVSVIDTIADAVVATPVAGSDVAVAPDGKRAYVTNTDSFNVSVIDTASNTVTAEIPLTCSGGGPGEDVAVAPDGKHIYVTCIRRVSAIDTATNEIVAFVSGVARQSPLA
jgi:YVTN family beta-propeller protein